jgi:cardiolipin synthase
MIAAYFAPNWGILRRLGAIPQRNGTCQIILAAFTDNTTTVAAARHCTHRLLDSGVEVFEFVTQKMHTKLIIADDAVYIGSANFDARSLYINIETMLRIEDASLAQAMRKVAQAYVPHTQAISQAVHKKRASWLNRMRWLLAYFIVFTLDYTVSRRLNIDDSVEEVEIIEDKKGVDPVGRPVKFLGEDA